MALDPLVLGPQIATQLATLPGVVPGPPLQAFTLCIATAVIAHITANAEVHPLPGLAAPPGGGPVTGLGSIK